eukprot:CAMPEP_0116126148 /NCGR_PEP_ID=MMETSP0329-20121206/6183_1 /TAXON_ID=697910 /ORGANISM="Pseudo-nitzschia arenysensis, Strain B593" /LENGTH=87 /DNA_ID=CAMNT_0003620223 /DNA_START=197 /DNA_END=460 /DNA_ORIENTATION=-
MGIFYKKDSQQEDDVATIPTLSEWKKARKQEKKARAEAFESKKVNRANKIRLLVQHRNANSGTSVPKEASKTKKGSFARSTKMNSRN